MSPPQANTSLCFYKIGPEVISGRVSVILPFICHHLLVIVINEITSFLCFRIWLIPTRSPFLNPDSDFWVQTRTHGVGCHQRYYLLVLSLDLDSSYITTSPRLQFCFCPFLELDTLGGGTTQQFDLQAVICLGSIDSLTLKFSTIIQDMWARWHFGCSM